MKLRNKLLEIYKGLIMQGNLHFFDEGYESQKEQLDKFQEPSDLTQRSYFQYLCQMHNKPLLLKIVQNLAAIPLIIYYVSKKYKVIDVVSSKQQKIAVFIREGIDKTLIPDSLMLEFPDIYETPMNEFMSLDRRDKTFISNHLLKYVKSPFFILKCIIKLGSYSYLINKNYPDAVITHNEYSFTCSFLTEYCRFNMVEHINIMHGEKLYDIRDSFVCFDRFYVWDRHYVDLFSELRADKAQFRMEIPSILKIPSEDRIDYPYEITYYLAGENEATMRIIALNLERTGIQKGKICVRYHPRYSNKETIRNIFNEFDIQDPLSVTIRESLENTEYVVSLYSTVLFQAYVAEKKIVIDDVTSKSRYEKLKALKYIMINKEHILLSSLLR